jgi:hypothetical protein
VAGEQPQLLSPLDRAREALQAEPLDTTLMVRLSRRLLLPMWSLSRGHGRVP